MPSAPLQSGSRPDLRPRPPARVAPIAWLCLPALLAQLWLPAGAALLRVPAEYPTIQYALISAAARDTVLVAPGTRYENIVWPATPSLTLLSEAGPEATTIDGMGVGSVIRFTSALDSTTIVRGFTITHGEAELGGGIRCENASPLIAGNRFVANRASGYGGGFYCGGGTCAPILRDNVLLDNVVLDGSGGGICAYLDAFPVITGNEFHGNRADLFFGGAIHCEEGSSHSGQIVIADNEFTGNSALGGGAISLFNPFALAPEVRGNQIVGNSAQFGGGGVLLSWSLATMTDNVIRENHAGEYGGGVYLEESHTVRLSACEVGANTAGAKGGGIAFVGWCHGPEVIDCAITGNSADHGGGVFLWYYCTPVLRQSGITGNEAAIAGGAVYCEQYCEPTFDGVLVRHNQAPQAGGMHFVGSAPLIQGCTIAENGDIGLRFGSGWLGHVPQVHDSDISGHAAYGIENTDSAVTVAAESNWWGDPSGPYHPLLNPAGLGDPVSDFVSFSPWRTEPASAGSSVSGPSAGAPPLVRLTCSPNPFRGRAVLRLAAGEAAGAAGERGATVAILDATGRVLQLLPLERTAAGGAEAVWRGEDRSGLPVPAGIYYARLAAGGAGKTVKLVRVD